MALVTPGPILVAGVGQIGTFVARALARRGVEVVGVDRDPAPGYVARYGRCGGRISLRAADLCDASVIAALLSDRRIDTVILCTGLSSEACGADPERAREILVGGARALARAGSGGRLRRIVLVSSVAVYGAPEGDRFRETDECRPRTAYGRLKREAENILLDQASCSLDVIVARACGSFGPLRLGSGSRSALLIEALVVGARRGRSLTLRAHASACDEYLYVKDLGEALADMALRRVGQSRIINVGSGRATSAEQLRQAVLTAVPSADILLEDEGRGLRTDPIGPAPHLDVTRLTNELGFEPRFTLAGAFADYIDEAGL